MIELSCLPFCIGLGLVERMCKKDWLCGYVLVNIFSICASRIS